MKKPFYIINRINEANAEILMYGYIDRYDVSAESFIVDLNQLAAKTDNIKIRINSGGGSVFEGIAIYNAIKRMNAQGKTIDTVIDGIAASMGGVIAMAGKNRSISKYGRLMTHRAQGYAVGDADKMREQADLVESAEKDIVKIFEEITGLPEADVREKFLQKGKDNWMTAAQSIEHGFVHDVYDAEPVKVPENTTGERDLHNLFDTCLNQHKNSTINNMKEIAKSLGLPEDATEDQINSAIAKLNKKVATADEAALTRATELVENAIHAGKVKAERKDGLIKSAVENYDSVKDLIDSIPGSKKPNEIINRTTDDVGDTGDNDDTPAVTAKKGEGWAKLMQQGMAAVENCRKNQPQVYAALYKDKYGRLPSEMGFKVN